MDRLKIGVIGLGWFGEIHCDTIAGVANLELAALCTRTPDRLRALADKFGVAKTYRDYRELLADPSIDAVSVVTMWDQHTEPAIAALEAGKHVFLEKPMASTVADCNRIIAAAARSKGILLIGHICRLQDTFPNLAIGSDKLHSPDTTYWPLFDGVRLGALRDEFAYIADCALKGKTPAIGRPEDAAAALAATLAAEQSARSGKVIEIRGE